MGNVLTHFGLRSIRVVAADYVRPSRERQYGVESRGFSDVCDNEVGLEDNSWVRNRSWRVQHNKIAGSYVNPQPRPLLGLHFVQLTLHNTALSAGVKASNDNGRKTDHSSKTETDDFGHPEMAPAYISRIRLVILSLKLLNDTFD